MCLSNVDMEPLRNIMVCRDIFGIENSHQLKPEVKKFQTGSGLLETRGKLGRVNCCKDFWDCY